ARQLAALEPDPRQQRQLGQMDHRRAQANPGRLLVAAATPCRSSRSAGWPAAEAVLDKPYRSVFVL
ncbi:MAG TPA: hypothetical protein VFS35_10400, partial [Terrimicrobiaceae bacterium]|nr:hypothetical protein [Terrimicrobiaceae bacterium]